MQLTVTAWDGATVALHAPLAPNQNHADTAFGGSISTAGIMAGFCLLHLLFNDRGISTRVLIQKSSTEFLRPIDADLISTATLPAPEKLEEFLATIRRKRRCRIELPSEVRSNHALCATHTGLFVAMLY
jgi:thioesterase domain-containing protein